MAGKSGGYVRVSTAGQNVDRQLDGMELHKVFEDRCSGADVDRPALKELLEWVREEDVVTCTRWTGWRATCRTCASWWTLSTARAPRFGFTKKGLICRRGLAYVGTAAETAGRGGPV